MRLLLLPLSLAVAALAPLGCGPAPVAADNEAKKTSPASEPQRLPPPPVVPADAYANVAAAMAEVETATASGRGEDQKKLVLIELWLAQRGASIEPELAAAVKDPQAGVASRITACRALAKLGAVATPTLMAATASETKRVRYKAIDALGSIEPPTKEIVEKLVSLLDDPDQDARRAALLGLSKVGPKAKSFAPGLVERLTGILNNLKEEDTLRTAAHSALKKVDPRTKLQN